MVTTRQMAGAATVTTKNVALVAPLLGEQTGSIGELEMNDKSKPSAEDEPQGITVKAGDRLYIPAGGLQMWIGDDGTFGTGVTMAVDPWLPDLTANSETPLEVIESITANGFPVRTICKRGQLYACRKTHPVRSLIFNTDIQRLRHMAVVDEERALGVLDLDKARGAFQHKDSGDSLRVDDLFEPLNKENSMRGDAPLMDYLLAADKYPFRMVEVGGKLSTVDVEDLQKVPVRVVVLMWFSYLESLLTRRLCEEDPNLLDIIRSTSEVEGAELGTLGTGPERRVERFHFGQLLSEASRRDIVSLQSAEIEFLGRYRNNIFHGPRWYITRRSEVATLVSCVKKVVSLARDLARE